MTSLEKHVRSTSSHGTPNIRSLDQKISYLKSKNDPGNIVDIPLWKWLHNIRIGKWRDKIIPLRKEYREHGKSTRYKNLKGRLSAPTPAGLFSYKDIENLIRGTGILHADVDGISLIELFDAIERLRRDPYTLYLFLSPSGQGIKFAVLIPIVSSDEEYKSYFRAYERYCLDAHGLTLDPSCKDISRLCFNSFDPDLYVNTSSELFTDYYEEERVDTTLAMPKAPTVGLNRNVPPVPRVSIPSMHAGSIPALPSQERHIPMLSMPTAYVPALPHSIPQATPAWPDYKPSHAERQMQWAIDTLQAAGIGTRNHTRIKVARLIGGLIAGSQLPQSAADELAEIAASYSENPKRARRDINNGLRYGYDSPIYTDSPRVF